MFENMLKALLKICGYSRNKQQSYNNAFYHGCARIPKLTVSIPDYGSCQYFNDKFLIKLNDLKKRLRDYLSFKICIDVISMRAVTIQYLPPFSSIRDFGK